MPVWHSVRPRQTRANNQEKVELSLSFRALEIMEIAKEEKSYYSQALGTHNLTLFLFVLQILTALPGPCVRKLLLSLGRPFWYIYPTTKVAQSQACRGQHLILNSQDHWTPGSFVACALAEQWKTSLCYVPKCHATQSPRASSHTYSLHCTGTPSSASQQLQSYHFQQPWRANRESTWGLNPS